MRLYHWVMNQVQKTGYDAYLHSIYVRCSRCNESLQTRVDLRNDLSILYGDAGDPDTYFTRKIIVGNNLCFQPIEVELKFDGRRRIMSQKITGGELISEQDYFSATAKSAFTPQESPPDQRPV